MYEDDVLEVLKLDKQKRTEADWVNQLSVPCLPWDSLSIIPMAKV